MARAWVGVVVVLGCGGSNGDNRNDAGPPDDADASIDAPVDADEGAGFRVELVATGVRDPFTISLRVGNDVMQELVVTEDAMVPRLRFPRKLATGTQFQLEKTGPQQCVFEGPTSIASADAVVTVTCDGVLDLRAFTSSHLIRLDVPFDPRGGTFAGSQPYLLEPTDTTTLTWTPMYQGVTPDIVVSPSPFAPGSTVTITSSLPGKSIGAKQYSLELRRELLREAYGKASEIIPAGNLGGVDSFGSAQGLALSDDTLVAGAPGKNAVYVYRRSGTTWTFEQKLAGGVAVARFGFAVAISGNTIAVGAPDDGVDGAVYIYRRTGTTWTQDATVLRPTTTDNARAGASVALSPTHVVVGAPQNGANQEGSVFVYTLANLATAPTALHGSETLGNLGATLALSGTDLAIGAPRQDNNRGAVYACVGVDVANATEILGTVNSARFGAAIALDGNRLAVGSPSEGSSAGHVRVFTRTGATWTTRTALPDINASPTAGSRFGAALAFDSGHLLVGAPEEATFGAVYLYRCASSCSADPQIAPDFAASPSAFDQFALAVAIRGDTFAVAAPFEDSAAINIDGTETSESASASGAFYVYR